MVSYIFYHNICARLGRITLASSVNDVFNQFSLIPLLCIDYLDLDSDSDSNPDSNIRIAQYKKDVQKAIASLKLSKFEQLIENYQIETCKSFSNTRTSRTNPLIQAFFQGS